MSDLNLAQNHALDLARTLMVPVTLFEIDGEIGVIAEMVLSHQAMKRVHV